MRIPYAPHQKVFYSKLPKTLDEQVKLLQERGLGGNAEFLKNILRNVNYYRLTGFLCPFRDKMCENFKPGTTVEHIWQLYTFDRRLRGHLFDCISRIEVALRTQFAYRHTIDTGNPFCYTSPSNFDLERKGSKTKYDIMLGRIRASVEKAKDRPCVVHFRKAYTNEDLPLWMAIETVEFGVLPHYFELMPKRLRISIANGYGVTDRTFAQWLILLNRMRNRCAHHERLLFSDFASKGLKRHCDAGKNAVLQNLYDAIQPEDDTNGASLYLIVSIFAHLLSCLRPESQWRKRFRDFMLAAEHRAGRRALPGFCEDFWLSCELWK